MIELSGVWFRYAKGLDYALKNVSLSISSPGVYTVVGPNGSGKTTLLRLITGLLKPSMGSVRVLGADPYSDLRIRKLIGYHGGNPGFYPSLTAYQNLFFFCMLKLGDKALCRDEVTRLANLLDMGNYLGRKVKELSQGYVQRLAILRAFIGEPKIVVLDEPFAHLDTSAIDKLKLYLVELAKKGSIAVLATHVMPYIADVANSIAILDKGRIVFYGGRDELEKAVGIPLDRVSIHALIASILRRSPQ